VLKIFYSSRKCPGLNYFNHIHLHAPRSDVVAQECTDLKKKKKKKKTFSALRKYQGYMSVVLSLVAGEDCHKKGHFE